MLRITEPMLNRAERRRRFIHALQRACQRHELIVQLYRRLAAQAPTEQHEQILLNLAAAEANHQQRYMRTLRRLHAAPLERVSLLDQLWLWLLPHCGLDLAMRWIAWAERCDTKAVQEAALLVAALPSHRESAR